MRPATIHWVVALKPEAQPLIDALQLKLVPGNSLFPVYENVQATHRMVISGVGKVNAAAATAWLGQFGGAGWVNFGIAGNFEAEIGTVFRAGRVIDAGTKKSWYPPAVWPSKLDRFSVTQVLTIDTPTSDYPEPNISVEMEAAGFFPTALRFGCAELVQVIKVISDNAESNLSDLTPKIIRGIVEAVIDEVLRWSSTCLEPLITEELERTSAPPGWAEIIGQYRFTETEKHILKREARRAIALGRFQSLRDWCSGKEYRSGKDILAALTKLLADAEGAED